MFRSAIQEKRSMHIVNQVRKAILSGQLQPGHRLPTEKELLLQFGVSKHTLREALRALESMGFIEIRQGAGGGPVVSEVEMENTRDIIASFLYFKKVSIPHLCEVRKVFEPHLARMAAERATSEDIEALTAMNQAYRKSLTRKKPAIKDEVSFHVLLGEISGNPVMMLVLDFVNNLLTDLKAHLKPGIDFSEMVLAAHDDILAAIVARDGQAAADRMHRHICEVESGLALLQGDDVEEAAS